MIKLITAAAIALATASAHAEDTRFYGPDGRSIGTASPQGNGSFRYYDARGNNTGSSSTSSSGMTTYYGADGRVTGRASRPSGPMLPRGGR
jgi:YD repeat-containing protein